MLEETSQRASELSIIKTVIQSMSSQLQVEADSNGWRPIRDTLNSEVVTSPL